MLDMLYIMIAILFFAVADAFARGCGRLLREESQ
jgi:hypothetical protein